MTKECLIIDESSVIRTVVDRILTTNGFAVTQAESATKAIEHCQSHIPDAIIVDWHMSDQDSISLISTLRQCGNELKRPKIIFLTSEMDVGAMTRAKRAGADAFFMKPFDRKSVENKIVELGLAA